MDGWMDGWMDLNACNAMRVGCPPVLAAPVQPSLLVLYQAWMIRLFPRCFFLFSCWSFILHEGSYLTIPTNTINNNSRHHSNVWLFLFPPPPPPLLLIIIISYTIFIIIIISLARLVGSIYLILKRSSLPKWQPIYLITCLK
ncbi:hypothetical protein M747DRAFT_106038 [Aspergillus niger ATCC 13496]|uniref:Uncharacterized protein n=2 Tax=Aspergillus niger TaxID=5061 RepID=A0A370BRD9_ASPNG|nr:hypothetical protein M747DRAFT_106038 [Aspergillus niger ATCC 13496]